MHGLSLSDIPACTFAYYAYAKDSKPYVFLALRLVNIRVVEGILIPQTY